VDFRSKSKKSIPIFYDELFFDDGYRADLIVEKRVLLELKSVETFAPCSRKASSDLYPVG